MIPIFSAHGTDGTDQPKVVQEVLADLKISFEEILKCDKVRTYNLDPTPRLIFGLVNVN